MAFSYSISGHSFSFKDLKDLMAKASPLRSGDELSGIASGSAVERVAAQYCLAEQPLKIFLEQPLIPYEKDEVTRLILDNHDQEAFAEINHLSVGEFRDFLLHTDTDSLVLERICKGITPEMASAVSKIMRNQDLILVSSKREVVSRFRNTLGLKNRFSTRLQPNHPTDDARGILTSIIDGLFLGSGDAVIGINPATDSPEKTHELLLMMDTLRQKFQIPTQSCVLSHITTILELLDKEQNVPVDLIFQSIAGTEKANKSFGISLSILKEAYEAGLEVNRGTLGNNLMYFETGQGSCLSADANFGVDQQTCEARAYAVARAFNPLLVNTVVGFIGPEYLFDGKQIIRAGLEDHFCGKLLGLPMGCDICYTNHAEADQDDMDILLTSLSVAGCNYIMGVPGADDIMLNYQSTSFHDALYVREVLGKKPAPEFEEWLINSGVLNQKGQLNRKDSGLLKKDFQKLML